MVSETDWTIKTHNYLRFITFLKTLQTKNIWNRKIQSMYLLFSNIDTDENNGVNLIDADRTRQHVSGRGLWTWSCYHS